MDLLHETSRSRGIRNPFCNVMRDEIGQTDRSRECLDSTHSFHAMDVGNELLGAARKPERLVAGAKARIVPAVVDSIADSVDGDCACHAEMVARQRGGTRTGRSGSFSPLSTFNWSMISSANRIAFEAACGAPFGEPARPAMAWPIRYSRSDSSVVMGRLRTVTGELLHSVEGVRADSTSRPRPFRLLRVVNVRDV